MSWLFSQALVEAFSEDICSDGAPSAPLSGSPTPQAFLPPDRMTTFSRPSRFGMTFAPLTDDLGAELLTWFLEASRAKTSASPAREQALTAPDQACGPTWRGSLARFDPALSSWRTAQPSLLGDSEECSVTWPRSGMTAGGLCWELPTLAPPTSATGSGLWVPTPCAIDAKPITGGNLYVTETGTVRHMRPDGKSSSRGLAASAAMWPTPTSSLGTKGGLVTPAKSREGGTLIEALSARSAWPTPTVCGNYNRKGASPTSGDGLETAVRKCATPTASPWRSGKASQATMDRNSRPLSEQIGGSLNPTWVELLMGWPKGWTSLEPMNAGSEDLSRQGVPCVRDNVQQAPDAERPTRGGGGVPEPDCLQPVVRQHAKGTEAEVIPVEVAQVEEGGMRGVWRDAAAACASLRSGPDEQRAGQLADAVPVLPRLLACDGEAAGPLSRWAHAEPWAPGWEDGVMRVANGVAARVDRLKAIGNGQVPLCAATAWQMLTSGMTL